MQINMIWSTDPNGYIGRGNNLVFRKKEDMQIFKELTTGNGYNAVVMGRKTFDSLGNKPLPNRLNLVMSKDVDYRLMTMELEFKDPKTYLIPCGSINAVLRQCERYNIEQLWVIGGKEIYEQFLDLADSCYITTFDEYAEYSNDLVQFLPDLSDFLSSTYISLSNNDSLIIKRRNSCTM